MPRDEDRDSKNLNLRVEHHGRPYVFDKADGCEIDNISGGDPLTWQAGPEPGYARLTLTLLVKTSTLDTGSKND